MNSLLHRESPGSGLLCRAMAKRLILLLAVMFTAQVSFAQNTLRVTIKDEVTKEPVVGASVTIKDALPSATTDSQGTVQLSSIPNGAQTIVIFSPGYESKELELTFPLSTQPQIELFLKVTNEVGEVTITSTRTGRGYGLGNRRSWPTSSAAPTSSGCDRTCG